MTLSASKLATELEAMVPADSENTGINNFATAFENYFYESTCGGSSVTNNSLTACTAALKSAMVGVSSSGASGISAGISAFWGVVAGSAALIWVTAPVLVAATPPPGLSGLTAAITTAGNTNISNKNSLEDSALVMANAIHHLMLGGLGTIVTPPGGTLPIL